MHGARPRRTISGHEAGGILSLDFCRLDIPSIRDKNRIVHWCAFLPRPWFCEFGWIWFSSSSYISTQKKIEQNSFFFVREETIHLCNKGVTKSKHFTINFLYFHRVSEWSCLVGFQLTVNDHLLRVLPSPINTTRWCAARHPTRALGLAATSVLQSNACAGLRWISTCSANLPTNPNPTLHRPSPHHPLHQHRPMVPHQRSNQGPRPHLNRDD